MSVVAFQIKGNSIFYSKVCSGWYKKSNTALLACCVRNPGINDAFPVFFTGDRWIPHIKGQWSGKRWLTPWKFLQRSIMSILLKKIHFRQFLCPMLLHGFSLMVSQRRSKWMAEVTSNYLNQWGLTSLNSSMFSYTMDIESRGDRDDICVFKEAFDFVCFWSRLSGAPFTNVV